MPKRQERDQLFYYISHFSVDKFITLENIISELNALEDINNVFYGNDEITLLILATKNYQSEIVELLLAQGADPNVGNRSGGRPLLFAIMKNDSRMTKIIDLLLEYGANPTLRSNGGQSIIEATEVCMKIELVERFQKIAKKFELE